jgi:hypothetical protein
MSKGTMPRAVRIAEPLWKAALAKARDRGETITDVVRRALEEYVASPPVK